MRREEMQRTLRDELSHIPRGDLSQNEFRMVYNIERRHDLAQDPRAVRAAALQAAIRSVQMRDPVFAPGYDRAFFAE